VASDGLLLRERFGFVPSSRPSCAGFSAVFVGAACAGGAAFVGAAADFCGCPGLPCGQVHPLVAAEAFASGHLGVRHLCLCHGFAALEQLLSQRPHFLCLRQVWHLHAAVTMLWRTS